MIKVYGLLFVVYGLLFVVCGLLFVVCCLWFVVCGLKFKVDFQIKQTTNSLNLFNHFIIAVKLKSRKKEKSV